MAQFIHLAAERDSRSILRSGIKVARNKRLLRGVFAHPQIENFVVNHQWMRELRRFRGLSFVGVRFRIPDAERVWIGKFNAEHIDVAASEAIGIARQHTDPLGLEVIVPRPIRAREWNQSMRRQRLRGGATIQAQMVGNRVAVHTVNGVSLSAARYVSRMTPNKQLQRTVRRYRGRAASASFHYAHAARFIRQRAAAELRR